MAPKGVKLQAASGHKAKLTWKKATAASGYQIMWSTNQKFKGKKITKINKRTTLKKTLPKMKAGKTCYAKIRSLKKSKTTKYSKWSPVVKVVIK